MRERNLPKCTLDSTSSYRRRRLHSRRIRIEMGLTASTNAYLTTYILLFFLFSRSHSFTLYTRFEFKSIQVLSLSLI